MQNTAQKRSPIRRGAQSKVQLRAGIIGGGRACENLLALLSAERLERLNMKILGVADPDREAPGMVRARDQGIFTTPDFKALFALSDLNLLIELTGSTRVREDMIRTKPMDVSSIDHRGARLLWDLIQMETEKQVIQKQSEERLRQFLESAHDIICIKDLKGRYLYVNPAAVESMNITRESVLGKTDSEIFSKGLSRAMAAHDREMLEKRQILFSRERMKANGRWRHFHTVRFPMLDDNGEMVSYAIIARDMTEEVVLQEEVQRNKEYLENILQHSSDMIITTDLEGRIVTFNRGGELMLGFESEEILGTPIERLWKAPGARQELMAEVAAAGAVNNHPAILIAKNGDEVEVSLSLSQLRDSKGKVLGTVGISKDVTEENRLRRQLIEQERLAAVGQTVAGVTHCMKNVLNGLKGGAYLVGVGLKRADNQLIREGWENVQKGIERISKLSLDMLSYCREREPAPVPTDLMKLVRDTADMVAQSARQEGIEVAVTGDESGRANLDPDTVSRALLNLVSNAVDACREKSYPCGQTPRVEVRAEQEGGEARFAVSDNGVGMTEEVRGQLFKRFFSTKDGRGTGLGLCTTAKIIDEHGGRITVQSSPARGSVFTVILPDLPVKTEAYGSGS
jgi:PAS domain S-box-containing protein